MKTEYSVAAHWPGNFDETGLRQWAEDLRRQLRAPQVSLGLVFMTPRFFPYAKQVLEILRVHARIPLLAGCSSTGLVAGAEEIEDHGGVALALYALPGATLNEYYFTQSQVEDATGPDYWPAATAVPVTRTNGWLTFMDPFHLDAEKWLRSWNEAYAPTPVFGGLASGVFSEQATQIYLNGDIFEEGGVAISVGGDVKLTGVISQGCTPIGETWTLTRVEQNLIRPAAPSRSSAPASIPSTTNSCRSTSLPARRA